MLIDILMIGKIGERGYRDLAEGYLRRFQDRARCQIVHCRDEDEMARRTTGQGAVVALDEHGKTRDSMQFARWLTTWLNAGTQRLTFCLGGAAGLDPRVRNTARETISLSPFTLNHQLALLVLVEQLYRGFSILAGEPYHKA